MLIPEPDQRDLLIYAFRYALGRRTYSTATVSKIIIDSWAQLSKHDRVLYQREIREATELEMAGDDCDIQAWRRILLLEVGL